MFFVTWDIIAVCRLYSAPYHYLNQCWHSINLNHNNTFQLKSIAEKLGYFHLENCIRSCRQNVDQSSFCRLVPNFRKRSSREKRAQCTNKRKSAECTMLSPWEIEPVDDKETGGLTASRSLSNFDLELEKDLFNTPLVQRDLISIPIWYMWCGAWYWTWWRHQMEAFSALLAFCAGNSPVTGEFPVCDRWIPRIKANDAELWCFLWSAPEWTVE